MRKKVYPFVIILFILSAVNLKVSAQPNTMRRVDSLKVNQAILPINLHHNPNPPFQRNNRVWLSNPYPNPTNDIVNVNLSLPEGIHNASIKISDLTGKTIKTLYVGFYKKKISIDMSPFNKGIYFLSLYYEGSLVKSKAIIFGEK